MPRAEACSCLFFSFNLCVDLILSHIRFPGYNEILQLAKKRKRAEINKKLGVKRLKLEMPSKTRKVIPCSFYQKGRCQKVLHLLCVSSSFIDC